MRQNAVDFLLHSLEIYGALYLFYIALWTKHGMISSKLCNSFCTSRVLYSVKQGSRTQIYPKVAFQRKNALQEAVYMKNLLWATINKENHQNGVKFKILSVF